MPLDGVISLLFDNEDALRSSEEGIWAGRWRGCPEEDELLLDVEFEAIFESSMTIFGVLSTEFRS